MTWWKGLIAGVLLLAVAGITVAGLRDRPPPATEVQVAKVRKGTISRVIIGAGKVEASTTVKISSNLSGDLVERPVELGDKVKKGQVLGRIDPRPFDRGGEAGPGCGERGPGRHRERAGRGGSQQDAELGRVEGLAKRGMASGAEVEQGQVGLRRRAGTGRRNPAAVPGAGRCPGERADQRLPDHPGVAHRGHGHRAEPGDRRAGARLRLLRGHRDDGRRAEQHGGEDRGRRARGRAPQATASTQSSRWTPSRVRPSRARWWRSPRRRPSRTRAPSRRSRPSR